MPAIDSSLRKGYFVQGTGTAGAPDPAVLTVQGIAGGTNSGYAFVQGGTSIPDPSLVLLPSAVRAGNTTVTGIAIQGYKGMLFRLNVTVNPGGGQFLQARILSPNLFGNVRIVDFGTIVTAANGGFFFAIYPGSDPLEWDISTVAAAANAPLPATFGVIIGHSGAGNWTYELDAVPLM
jgi:hypothetical protein